MSATGVQLASPALVGMARLDPPPPDAAAAILAIVILGASLGSSVSPTGTGMVFGALAGVTAWTGARTVQQRWHAAGLWQ